MRRNRYTLTAEPRGTIYRGIFQAAREHCESALLVVRNGIAISPRGTEVLRRLRPWEISCEDRADWPGTLLIGDTARVYRFSMNHAVYGILTEVTDALFDWEQPSLPEDPCFQSPNGEPWLTTISHERDAYLDLTADEHDELLRRIPTLQDMMVLEESDD